MSHSWSPRVLAGELFDVLPTVGRLVVHLIDQAGEEKATLMQVKVLSHLREHPLTTSELARRRKISLQSASVLVQGLVERGWVVRIPDPNDRRQARLEVTPEGVARAERVKAQTTTALAALLEEEFTADEITAAAVFLPALKRLATKYFVDDDELDV